MRSVLEWLAFGMIAATLTACSGGGSAAGERWIVGEDRRLEGRVIAVDATQMVVDGDGEITLGTEHGTVLIRIPARENLCEARGLGEFWAVASGDSLRLKGRVTRPGEVTVCSGASHFLETVGPLDSGSERRS